VTNYLCTLRGTLYQPTLNEIFVHTIAISSTASSPAVMATQVHDTWQTAWAGATGLKRTMCSGIKYTEATAANILDLSTGALGAAAHVPFAPVLAGQGVKASPSHLAMCISLLGGPKPNGTPYRGRFYLPPPDASYINVTDGRCDVAYHYADGVKDFFDLLVAGGHVPSVWSRSASLLTPVGQIKCGDRFDTIRRRRNKGGETYVVGV
jgi:hypothetical protein